MWLSVSFGRHSTADENEKEKGLQASTQDFYLRDATQLPRVNTAHYLSVCRASALRASKLKNCDNWPPVSLSHAEQSVPSGTRTHFFSFLFIMCQTLSLFVLRETNIHYALLHNYYRRWITFWGDDVNNSIFLIFLHLFTAFFGGFSVDRPVRILNPTC